MKDDTGEIFTLDEVAAYLKVGKRTVRAWTSSRARTEAAVFRLLTSDSPGRAASHWPLGTAQQSATAHPC